MIPLLYCIYRYGVPIMIYGNNPWFRQLCFTCFFKDNNVFVLSLQYKTLYEKINLNFYIHFMFLLSVPHKIYNKTCVGKFYFKYVIKSDSDQYFNLIVHLSIVAIKPF